MANSCGVAQRHSSGLVWSSASFRRFQRKKKSFAPSRLSLCCSSSSSLLRRCHSPRLRSCAFCVWTAASARRPAGPRRWLDALVYLRPAVTRRRLLCPRLPPRGSRAGTVCRLRSEENTSDETETLVLCRGARSALFFFFFLLFLSCRVVTALTSLLHLRVCFYLGARGEDSACCILNETLQLGPWLSTRSLFDLVTFFCPSAWGSIS